MNEKLSDYIKAHNITQYRLAKMTELNHAYINRVINKNYDVRMSTAKKLANALKCKIDDIF